MQGRSEVKDRRKFPQKKQAAGRKNKGGMKKEECLQEKGSYIREGAMRERKCKRKGETEKKCIIDRK